MSASLERVIAEQQAKIDAQNKTIGLQRDDMERLQTSMQYLVSEVFMLLNHPNDPGVDERSLQGGNKTLPPSNRRRNAGCSRSD